MASSKTMFDDWKPTISSKAVMIAAMGAIAGYQGATALVDAWKWVKNRQSNPSRENDAESEYRRVVNGEMRRGWRMALPAKFMLGGERARHKIVALGWTTGECPSEYQFETNSSILIRSTGLLPDGKKIVVFRRHSLLRPENVNATLSNIVYDPAEWSHQFTCYLTPSTVGSVFRRRQTDRFRLAVMHAFQRQPIRLFDLESPMADGDVQLIYANPDARQIRIVFGKWTTQEPEDELADEEPVSRFETSIAVYNLRRDTGDEISMQHSTTAETLSIPVGKRDTSLSFQVDDRSMVVFLYEEEESKKLHRHLCLTVNRDGGWRVENMVYWMQGSKIEFDRRKTGVWKLVQVLESFRALKPTKGCCRVFALPLLRYGAPVETRPIGDSIYAMTTDGVFQRWSSPPSIKMLAAECLLRRIDSSTKEKLSRDLLKKSIGFDIFDGVPKKIDSEEDAPMMFFRD